MTLAPNGVPSPLTLELDRRTAEALAAQHAAGTVALGAASWPPPLTPALAAIDAAVQGGLALAEAARMDAFHRATFGEEFADRPPLPAAVLAPGGTVVAFSAPIPYVDPDAAAWAAWENATFPDLAVARGVRR